MSEQTVAAHHIKVLREILGREYLRTPDLHFAVRDLARMAREALGAREAIVGLWNPRGAAWSACTSTGKTLEASEISEYGSLSILNQVRDSAAPFCSGWETPLAIRSESILTHELAHVLAVPITFWEVSNRERQRYVGGCLYADRTIADGPFTGDDVQLVFDITRIAEPILNVLRHVDQIETRLSASYEHIEELKRQVAAELRLGEYESRDPWIVERVLPILGRVSRASKVNIVILGPSGSGKSFLAKCYHYACPRREAPFVTLDCAQVTSAETLAAELFGFAPRSGYFNAPPAGRPGKAALANGGTLFIDEVGALPGNLQQQLLRVIQDGEFSPLGSGESASTDVQIIAATNEDLARAVREGRFREDLYWRLKEVTIQLPSLSRRPADVPLLAERLLARARQRFAREDLARLTPDAIQMLVRQDWSRCGNIRGLEHTITRSVLLAPVGKAELEAEDLAFEPSETLRERDALPRRDEGIALRSDEVAWRREDVAPDRAVLLERIHHHGGNLTSLARDPEVARALGYYHGQIPPSTLSVRLESLDLRAALQEARSRRAPKPQVIVAAIRDHGCGTAAADALGISRNTLVWELRKAGLSVRDVRRGLPLTPPPAASGERER
ncbi:MAG: sigma-54-dependent Fis family transcriptional regulator [Candidatus Schekmanbacteria bacterium]|nr:sigma-54-dependent Fis family transcriptional regulator [Candidatus Schekmanbacteria bacterium]